MRILVVGASVAGLSACEALRDAGYADELVLVGNETTAPYDRPPLSKQILTRSMDREDILLRQPEELGVVSHLGTTATRLDLAGRRIVTDSGAEVPFDGLVLATGSRARELPDQPVVHGLSVLRTLEDALAVREALRSARSVVVVGAGFIGLEVASSARSLGCRVTVLESAAHPMSRVLPAAIGDLFAELHRREGTDVRCTARLEEVLVSDGRVTGVRLHDETRLAAELVVLGLGAIPNDQWLGDSGLSIGDGVECDGTLRAAAGVYACGDVARWPHPLFGSIRVEHWTTAVDHGRTAARNLLADLRGDATAREAADAIPYFWSDQCGIKLQLAGWANGADAIHATVDGERFAVLLGKHGRLVAVLTGGWPRTLALLRRSIATRTSLEAAQAQLPRSRGASDSVLERVVGELDSALDL